MDFWKIINKKVAILLSVFLIILVAIVLYQKPLFSNLALGLDSFGHLSRASYLQEYGLVSWDMSWYSGEPFLKFYPPLFYFVLSLFPNLVFGSIFLCFLSILLCSIGIFFLVKYYTKDFTSSLIAALFFLSVINLSYYSISVGNYPYVFSLWTIPFTLLFLEKALINKNHLFIYSLFFLIGFLSHIFIGFVLIFLVFLKILIYSNLKIKDLFKNCLVFLMLPIFLTAFWFFPFLAKSSSFVGEEIFIPRLNSLFGIGKTITWGIGPDSIGIAFLLFIVFLFFVKKNFKDKNYLYLLISCLSLFLLLMGILGHYYPRGIGSIRFIIPFSILMCVFIGFSLSKSYILKKFIPLLFVLLFVSLLMNYLVINSNYEDYSYNSDNTKFGQFGTIHKDFYEKDFPIKNNFSIYRFGSARFPFSRDLNFVFPKINQISGYYDQGILYEDTFYRMKNSVWDSNDLNKTFYYLDWFGVEFFEVSGGYLSDYGNKFNHPDFNLVFEKKNNTYPYRIYKYKNPSLVISVVRTNFVSFFSLNDSFIEDLSKQNKNTKNIVPFVSDENISIKNDYSLLPAKIIRHSPDIVEVDFDNFSEEEGILFKESYDSSWKAQEFPSEKPLRIYRTANDFMLILPNEGANKILIYQSKSFVDYFGLILSIFSLIVLIIISYSSLFR